MKGFSKVLLILIIIFVLAASALVWYIIKINQKIHQAESQASAPIAKTFHEKTTTQDNSKKEETKTQFGKKVFFVHHSTGQIYWDNGLKDALEKAGFEAEAPWWDGNTDPQDFFQEFSDQTKWQILEPYDIIIFKSCFPASNIDSDEQLENYKNWYNELYAIYKKYPQKLFVPLSTPPLLKDHTTPEAASRSLAFEKWLLGDYKTGYDGTNLAPFGLHTLLSDEEGYLNEEFISSQEDDHPNTNSGNVVGPALVKHINSVLE